MTDRDDVREEASPIEEELLERVANDALRIDDFVDDVFVPALRAAYARGLEDAATIAAAVDSGRGNEKFIVEAIRAKQKETGA